MKRLHQGQYQRLYINKNRALKQLQELRLIRNILSKAICELLKNTQRKACNSKSYDDMLGSLGQCKKWLANSLKPLRRSKYKFFELRPLNLKTGYYKLNRYVGHLENVLKDYAVFKALNRLKVRRILKRLLFENKRIIQCAIYMLELRKYSHENDLNLQSLSLRVSAGKELTKKMSFGKFLIPVCSEGLLKGLDELHEQLDLVSHSVFQNEQDPAREQASAICKTKTMSDIAALVIRALFAQKKNNREILKDMRSNTGNDASSTKSFIPMESLGDVWNDVIKMHNQLLKVSKRSILDIKEELKYYYLLQMQIFLRNVLKRHRKDSILQRISSNAESSKYELKVKDTINLHDMHRMFYKIQLKKLVNSQKYFNLTALYRVIMSHDLSHSVADQDLLKAYQCDPHHYNTLLLLSNNDPYMHEEFLHVINQNYEDKLQQIGRFKRRQMMHQMSAKTSQYSVENLANNKRSIRSMIYLRRSTKLVFDDEFFKKQRSLWATYFAEQKTTPTEFDIEAEQKLHEQKLSIEKRIERKQKLLQKRKNRKAMKSIVSLYTTPRLTHRLRQALSQIEEETQNQAKQKTEQLQEQPPELPISAEDDCFHFAEALVGAGSLTTCCSYCRNLQTNGSQTVTALDRFHSTYNKIISYGNQISQRFE